jgi:hypothetical protein
MQFSEFFFIAMVIWSSHYRILHGYMKPKLQNIQYSYYLLTNYIHIQIIQDLAYSDIQV